MKKNIYTALMMAALLLVSCEGFLDKAPHNSITDMTFWEDQDDALMGLSGVYARLYHRFFSAAAGDEYSRLRFDFMTDDGYASATSYWGNHFHVGQLTPTSSGLWTGYYSACFNVISSANIFLGKLELCEMDEPLKIRYEAEARFLRALAYHELVYNYGAVPLFVHPPVIDDCYHGRDDVSLVMQQVHEDLDFAITNLPDVSFSDGHAVRNSARACKARVYLFAGDWGNVVKYTTAVISSGKCTLYPDYQGMFFDGQGADNTEIIFSVKFKLPERAHSMSSYPAFAPLEDLVNDYYTINGLPITEDPGYDPDEFWENRDPRLRMSMYLEPGEPFPYDENNAYSWYFQGSPTKYRVKKYTCPDEMRQNLQDDHDYIHLRYADVLLMYAEAKNELGQFDEADWNLTMKPVRQRAGFTASSALDFPGGTQEELQQEIRHERRIEFAIEGMRYYDLKRWDILTEAYATIEGENPQQKTFNEAKGYLWPIPQNEIDYYEANGVDFPQNPGY